MRITHMLTGDATKRKLRRFKYQVRQQMAWVSGGQDRVKDWGKNHRNWGHASVQF